MSDLRELYQQLIIDHGRNPRHFAKLPDANHTHEGYNPLCGDRLHVYLREENGVIQEAKFEGSGCAISVASASLMMETIRGKTVEQIEALFLDFHELITHHHLVVDEEKSTRLGKLMALAGVSEFPMRIKCATLCWHTLQAAIKNDSQPVSTE